MTTDERPRDRFAAPGALTPAGSDPIVRLEGLEKYFGSNHVLRGCTLEVYPRETVCLIGRSVLAEVRIEPEFAIAGDAVPATPGG